MATGHFFKHQGSAGAPTLNNVAGSLIAVLDWALDVAGGTYWQKVYSGTNKAVYRATTGQRRYLRVDDTGTTQANIRAYNSMTDVDTGTEAFPTTTHAATWFFYKSSAATARNYRIVGDSRFFLLANQPVGGTGSTFRLMFGEATPYDPLDAHFTICMASDQTSTGYSANGELLGFCAEYFLSATQAPIYIARDPTGATPSRRATFRLHCYALNGEQSPAALAVNLPLKTLEVIDTGGTIANLSTSHARGTIPYIRVAPCSFDAGLTPYDVDFVADGSTWRPYNGFSNPPAGQLTLIRVSNDEPGRA